MRIHTRAMLASAGLAAAALLTPGCGDAPVDEALLEASIQLTSPGADGKADDPLREGAEQSIEVLKPWADDYPAASVLTALAELGVATAEIERVRGIETDVLASVRLTHTTRAVWLAHDARARAAAGVDVSDEIAQIDTLISDLSDEFESANAEREAIESKLETMNTAIADLQAKASAERDAAGEIMLRLNNMPADEAVPAAEKAREHTLAADKLDIEAARKSHIRDATKSEARDIQLRAEGLSTRIGVLRAVRSDAQARGQAADRDEADATKLANDTRKTLLAELDEARTAMDDELVPAFDALASSIQKAVARARSASGPVRATGALESANGGQLLAFVQWRKAAALRLMAQLERSVGETLGESALVERADQTEQAARDAHAAGAEAFSNAASALSGVRADSPNTQESLRTLAERLERFAQTEYGSLPDLTPAPAAGEDWDTGAADDAADTIDDTTPETYTGNDGTGSDGTGHDDSGEDAGDEAP